MRKFHIPKNPPTTSKSVRFPNDVIEQVETAIRGTDCTFSNFIVEATRVALENLAENSQAHAREYGGRPTPAHFHFVIDGKE